MFQFRVDRLEGSERIPVGGVVGTVGAFLGLIIEDNELRDETEYHVMEIVHGTQRRWGTVTANDGIRLIVEPNAMFSDWKQSFV